MFKQTRHETIRNWVVHIMIYSAHCYVFVNLQLSIIRNRLVKYLINNFILAILNSYSAYNDLCCFIFPSLYTELTIMHNNIELQSN